MTWRLSPGETIRRKDLHAEYGGRPQGGIGPSSKTPNVLLFTDPSTGQKHGYLDGWDGSNFHYYGEGQRGDQRMVSGNLMILQHEDDGRALRLFQGSRDEVEYLGEFTLDPKEPWYEADAPDNDGAIRKAIVFKLRPTLGALTPWSTPVIQASKTQVQVVPLAEQNTERVFVDPSREPYEADLREAGLVGDLRDHLTLQGHDVGRLKIVPKGEAKPLFADLLDETTNILVEAKGSVSREAIRMAIGQLADYSRFRSDATRVILVPEQPRRDLLELAASVDATVVWPSDGTYSASPSLPW